MTSVILVEDSDIERAAFVDVISRRHPDAKLRAFESAERCLDSLRSSEGDVSSLALVDVHLPGMDGIELAAMLRKEGLAERVILLATTPVHADLLADEANRIEAVAKPTSLEEIAQLITS